MFKIFQKVCEGLHVEDKNSWYKKDLGSVVEVRRKLSVLNLNMLADADEYILYVTRQQFVP